MIVSAGMFGTRHRPITELAPGCARLADHRVADLRPQQRGQGEVGLGDSLDPGVRRFTYWPTSLPAPDGASR
jgi:hypothetical protein